VNDLWADFYRCFGHDARASWDVDGDLIVTLTIEMYRHGGYDAGDHVGTLT
jgi:hypothetical protein